MPKDTLSEQNRVDILLNILANSRAREETAKIAYQVALQKERCSLHLAYELLGLKSLLGLSFDALAVELGRCVDPSALYKIAYRQQGIKLRTYKVLVKRINELRETLDLEPIDFLEWKEYR